MFKIIRVNKKKTTKRVFQFKIKKARDSFEEKLSYVQFKKFEYNVSLLSQKIEWKELSCIEA